MDTYCDLPQLLTLCRDRIQGELKQFINGDTLPLFDMLRYHMGWQDEHGHPCHKESGKFVRSTLCLLSCHAVGGNTSQILPVAAALELVHNFSLIHDDIMDTSYERHKRLTVWKLWGQSQAINAGDAMFALAYLTLLKLKDKGIAEEKILHSIQMLGGACLEICEGQYLDIDCQKRFTISVDDYLKMVRKKTAALMATSTALGAYLGTDDKKMVNCFYEFGEELGLAYQILDDILGIWGVEENTGKPVRDDILQRKKTFPVVYVFENSKGADRAELEALYSQESIQDVDMYRVMRILDKLDVRDYAANFAKRLYQRALERLGAAGLDLSRQFPLQELAHFLVERNY